MYGHDWRATVVFPNGSAESQAHKEALEKILSQRGYLTSTGKDDKGNETLQIHHLGAETDIATIFKEAGFLAGAGHLLAHPLKPFDETIEGLKMGTEWVAGSIHNPARANGVINTTAEFFLTAAGAGNKGGDLKLAKNWTQSVAGFSWLMQSVTYLFAAKTNEDRALDRIEKKIDATLAKGGDITQLKFDEKQDKEKNGIGTSIERLVRRYPVQIGALFNNTGMLFYLAHAWLTRRSHINDLPVWRKALSEAEAIPEFVRNPILSDKIPVLEKNIEDAVKYVGDGRFFQKLKTGFEKDVLGATLSLAGWTTLLLPPVKHNFDDDLKEQGFFKRSWTKFRENTPMVAGLFTLAASTSRLLGAGAKDNMIQAVGEKIYIGGDIALMFTNSHEYGGGAKLDPEKLSQQIMGYAKTLPVLMGDKEQDAFIDSTVKYWVDKHRADTADRKNIDHNASDHWIETSATELRQALTRKVKHRYTERMEHLCEGVSQLIHRFPKELQAEVRERVTQSLLNQPWLKATPEELKSCLDAAIAREPAPTPTGTVTAETIANDIKAIVGIIPNIDAAVCTAALYDSVSNYLRPQPEKPGTTVKGASRQDVVISAPQALQHA